MIDGSFTKLSPLSGMDVVNEKSAPVSNGGSI
jgi:hypothetical protein